jgi:hypothetical protein
LLFRARGLCSEIRGRTLSRRGSADLPLGERWVRLVAREGGGD